VREVHTTSISGAEAYGLAFVGWDQLARLAELAASYWKSVALAADRGDALTVAVHIKQALAVTREAASLAAELPPKGEAS
jgi:hypothetical protein